MKKILIIEDDETLRSAYITKLTFEGFIAEGAADGVEGLKKAEGLNPDLILLDLLMPNLDGIGFLKAYDLKNLHPGAKVLVFTNLSVPEQMKQALELGASRCIPKATVTPNEITKVIREELEK